MWRSADDCADELAVRCSLDETVAAVIVKLQKNKIHRVWVALDKKVVGVVSLGDVIAEILTE